MSAHDLAEFGNWLKERRTSLDLTQKELADAAGCSVSTIRKLEWGQRRPSKQVAELLSACLEIGPEEQAIFTHFARGAAHDSSQHPRPPVPTLSRQYAASSTPLHRDEKSHSTYTSAPQGAEKAANHRQPPVTNLPAYPTSFIGREYAVEQVRGLLWRVDVRLLTLTGPPGIGKTRLSIEAAAGLLDDFSDGIFFVRLATISNPDEVLPAVAQVLGLHDTGPHLLTDKLVEYLRNRNILLVVDNFEQVLDAGPHIAHLLAIAPRLKVLVTSRMPLHLYGEHEISVPVMELPEENEVPSLDDAGRFEAVQLFVRRAQAARPDLALTTGNAEDIVEICRRLDALPLAIELAAARVRTLQPRALRILLSSRLNTLTGGPRDLPARHQTLRAAIEWSYSLLSDSEKRLFRRMAVFEGGCTLSTLEAVCNLEATQSKGKSRVDVAADAESLLDKSLLQSTVGYNSLPRFRMLETLHEYAREELAASGEAEALAKEHALFFVRLVEEAEPHLQGARQQEVLELLQEEHSNVLAALLWTRSISEREDTAINMKREALEVRLRILASFWPFWHRRGYLSEGREQTSSAIELLTSSRSIAASPTLKAKVFARGGSLALEQGDYAEAHRLLQESLAIYRRIGDKDGIATSLKSLGNVVYKQGDYATASILFSESLALRRESGDKFGVALLLNNLGVTAYSQQDYITAYALYQESLVIRREIGDKSGIATALNNLAAMACEQKDYKEARALNQESLSIKRELGDKAGIAMSLGNLGYVSQEQGNYQEAYVFYRESLVIRRELGEKHGIAWCLVALGGVLADMGDAAQGARLLSAANALLEAISAMLDYEDLAQYERGMATARAHLSEDEFSAAWQEGQAMQVEEAIRYALEAVPSK